MNRQVQRSRYHVTAAVALSLATTVAAVSAVATTANATTASTTPDLESLRTEIRDALGASLEPGFYTVPDTFPAGALPSGASIGVRVPSQPDLLVGVGTEVAPADAPFDPTAPFDAGSVTFNAVFAIADMLVDDGTIDPSAALADWLPTYPNAEQITIEMLRDYHFGAHGMAVADWVGPVTADLSRNWTLEEVLANAAGQPAGAIGELGSADTATAALIYIIEQVTGESLDALIEQRLAEPLGLTDTGILDPDQLPAGYSHGHFDFGGTAATTADGELRSYFSFFAGRTGLVSTLSDQLTLLHALATGTLPGFERLPTPDRFPSDHLDSDETGDRYIGVGFPLNLHCPCTAVGDGHTGTSIGRRSSEIETVTHWYYFPATDITIVVHYNSGVPGREANGEVQAFVDDIHAIVSG